jgi:hypothetical protein
MHQVQERTVLEGSSPRRTRWEMRDLVVEASRALAHLDADRLEELALSCEALNRDMQSADPDQRVSRARESREAAGDMAIFARVLEATRDNLQVLNRLRAAQAGSLEYSRWPDGQ